MLYKIFELCTISLNNSIPYFYVKLREYFEFENMSSRNARIEIINTTIRMIQEKRYSIISTNHIAKEAGVSVGTLYYHFKNGKPDIIKEIIKRGYGQFLDKTNLKGLKIENLSEFLKAFLRRYIRQHRENVSLLIAIETELLTNNQLFKDIEFARNELKLFPLVEKILIQLDYPEKEQIDKVSKFLLNSIDSIIHRHVLYEKMVENDEELIDLLTQLIFRFIKLKH
jgi:AcrR family transcriptional regulator